MIKKIKILNLYAGIGGNRKLWNDELVDVTAVEMEPKIAEIYQKFYPNDTMIIGDAHEFLLRNYMNYDFIWASPPCPTHSRMQRFQHYVNLNKYGNAQRIDRYPDMALYQEIIFLTHFCRCKWVIENVVSYYNPLIKPYIVGNHYYWSNFMIDNRYEKKRKIVNLSADDSIKHKQEILNINLDDLELTKRFRVKILNNCVEPKTGLHIFEQAFKRRQKTLFKSE